MKLSLIIPCFNEGEKIPILINRKNNHFDSDIHEIILVDNGSSDGTEEKIKDLVKNSKLFKFVRV